MAALPNSFYVYPRLASEVMTREEYRECLKSSDGLIIAQGRVWNIVGKSLGAGMYKVSLEPSK